MAAASGSAEPQQHQLLGGFNPRFIFWVVFFISIIPCGWFIGASYVGLQQILSALNEPIASSDSILTYLSSHAEDPELTPEVIRAHLEYHTIYNRQSRANSLLSTRTWLRFMSSVFGSVVTFIGAIFVLARIETSSDSTISAKNISLRSSSPGILMVGVGAALMISPNFAPQEIETRDGAVYVTSSVISGQMAGIS